jgi:hypothetical protein
MMVIIIDQQILMVKLLMGIHHLIIIHMLVLKNILHVLFVIGIYPVHDIYLKMNDRIVLNVMKIVLLIHVKNVKEK